nr:hypothetical protein Iba_chr11aCG8060 [Ipomoea batatas]GMD51961.1 hypothetical protein Iba_chr11bCG7350 [Ipomoea batatas]GMD57018.1 hypothetical protein Iba_chr11eCG8720 [Ipomoea batatas]
MPQSGSLHTRSVQYSPQIEVEPFVAPFYCSYHPQSRAFHVPLCPNHKPGWSMSMLQNAILQQQHQPVKDPAVLEQGSVVILAGYPLFLVVHTHYYPMPSTLHHQEEPSCEKLQLQLASHLQGLVLERE